MTRATTNLANLLYSADRALTAPARMMAGHPAIRSTLVGATVLAALSVVVIPVRDSLGVANIGLAMAIVVGIVGSRVGLWAGLTAALWAACLFALLHSVPHGLPRIEDEQDAVTAGLLLVAGALSGGIHRRAQRSERRERAIRGDLSRLHRVGDIAARGAAAADVLRVASEEIAAELRLERCYWQEDPELDYRELQHNGLIADVSAFADPETLGQILTEGVAINLGSAGQFVLIGRRGSRPSNRELRVAVMLADYAAAALRGET